METSKKQKNSGIGHLILKQKKRHKHTPELNIIADRTFTFLNVYMFYLVCIIIPEVSTFG